MTLPDPVRRLADTHPQLEIWWDSSPLIYEEWVRGLGEPFRAPKLFDVQTGDAGTPKFGSDSLLRGATTNQPLTWQVIEGAPQVWKAWLEAQVDKDAALSVKGATWRLFIEVAARGADMLAPIFEGSGYRRGQVCCQVDPRDLTNLGAMLTQARRIHAARPNLMVKMPGTQEGIEGVRILTGEGIPTNVTLGYTVPQLLAVGKAAQAGLEEAHRRGTDLRYWRSCAVMMLGRFEDAPPLREQAQERGIPLTEADVRWAGIAIFRKAHRLFRDRGYPSKLMAASMRLGPTIDGVTRVWHLEKLAGANAVLTVFPNVFEAFVAAYGNLPLEPEIDHPVPQDVLERLLQIPYFVQAYEEAGIPPEDFASHPALQATAAGFSQAMEKIQSFARRVLLETH